MQALHLADHFAALEPWTPRLVASLNGQHVRLARLEGAFSWLVRVLEGSLELQLRERTIAMGEGDLFVVPRGVEHRPVANEGCTVLLFEPASVDSAGESGDPRGVAADAIQPLT